jgi:hypothetical protein
LEISINYGGHNSDNISYVIKLKEDLHDGNTLKTGIRCDDHRNVDIIFLEKSTFQIIHLKAGTKYIIDIYSCFKNTPSSQPSTLKLFTSKLSIYI